MALDTGTLVQAMTTAGENLGNALWNQMRTYALPELSKIAIQIVAIEENINDYTPEGAKVLLDMQKQASLGVIVAMTTLTLLDVQDAINTILQAIKTTVNAAVKFALIP
jgi:hypothetical protein